MRKVVAASRRVLLRHFSTCQAQLAEPANVAIPQFAVSDTISDVIHERFAKENHGSSSTKKLSDGLPGCPPISATIDSGSSSAGILANFELAAEQAVATASVDTDEGSAEQADQSGENKGSWRSPLNLLNDFAELGDLPSAEAAYHESVAAIDSAGLAQTSSYRRVAVNTMIKAAANSCLQNVHHGVCLPLVDSKFPHKIFKSTC